MPFATLLVWLRLLFGLFGLWLASKLIGLPGTGNEALEFPMRPPNEVTTCSSFAFVLNLSKLETLHALDEF